MTAPSERGLHSAVGHALIQAGRVLRRWSREPEVVIQTVVFPIVLFVVFRVVLGTALDQVTGAGSVTGHLVLCVLISVMFGGASAAQSLLAERRSGLLGRFRSMPVHRASVPLGWLLAEVARVLAGAVVLAAVGHGFGFRFAGGPPGALVFLLVAAWVAVGLGALVFAFALGARSAQSVAGVTMVYLLLMFYNTGFVPAQWYPDALRWPVRVMPISMAVDAMRGGAQGALDTGALAGTALWFGAMAVGGVVWGARRFAKVSLA
ncbi:ABC transporter permease [Pseudonocardia acaciae]|uniref:ABC transporter permease n=1 Tax=Pseudonocardia acaciae TaxID=551276 RepID=UPI000A5852E6|nr:ABC transporter permease [Pseudonocardia acaciae]